MWLSWLSGPVQDRMDILLSLKSVNLDQSSKDHYTSSTIRQRVYKTQKPQYQRYQKEITNAKVPFEVITETSLLTSEQQKMLMIVATKQSGVTECK